jgi:adenine phosphoribosyltransferase
LIEKLGGTVSEMAFIVNLHDIGGYKRLIEKGYKVFALTEFEGD